MGRIRKFETKFEKQNGEADRTDRNSEATETEAEREECVCV